MEKYYTPDISDFHIGFEFEYLGSIRNVTWEKIKCEQEDFAIMFDDWEHEMDGKFNELYRVKYLDREDIESEGWNVYEENPEVIIFNNHCSPIYYIRGNEAIIEGRYNKVSNWLLFSVDEKTIFAGFIKNISELRRLQKQLGIK